MDKHLDSLTLIEKPSRYLGSEVNAVHKDLSRVRLRVALAFPDLYEIGTSHFGLQILYHILNNQPEIVAERVFAPALDLETRLRRTGGPLCSLESHTPLGDFDIIGFSLLYELNYTNVLTMLELAGIPWLAAEREPIHPFVVAGGPCTCNPEPVADFFDAMVVGDGEEVVVELARAWLAWKEAGSRDRQALLKRWSELEGVYIPGFFEARYDGSGFQTLTPRFADYAPVKRAIVADLDAVSFPDRPVVPFGKPVHDRLRLEVSRGCSRGCRFCQAGMLYRPVRERAPERLFDLALKSLAATGYEDLSLLSLSTGDYGCIVPLLQRLVGRLASERVAVSLPSLRAGTLTPELMQLIKTVRKTGFTIAPEAGSQRLRDVINKNISEAEVIATVRDAFQAGWRLIKLYFMIGLPTETREDLTAMVELVQKLRQLKDPAGRRGQINVSVATFIPKPHTPFQWAPQTPLDEARDKLGWIQKQLSIPGVDFKWQNPEMSLLEGVWARGDRRLGRVLRAAHRRGCRFDGWGDRLNLSAWMAAFSEAGIDPAFYTTRPRDPGEPLPWDHIDTRVTKDFLRSEWEKALAGITTGDCRHGDCNACGSCDFNRIEPKLHPEMPSPQSQTPPETARQPGAFKKIQVSYAKTGPARFFGHLELVNVFLRALRRARIPVKFSEGFHPKPKVAFDNPLPTGYESEDEHLILTVPLEVTPAALQGGLNAQLPEGLRVQGCSEQIQAPSTYSTFRICFGPSLPESMSRALANIDFNQDLTISSPKGKLKKIALRDILKDIREAGVGCVELTLCCELGKTARPTEILKQGFGLTPEELAKAGIRKLKI
ncbi:MAG: TIGR03960 family B12-binding radical SAM protein [Hyphomicrobiales bacterium]